jgi:hypothetical protein
MDGKDFRIIIDLEPDCDMCNEYHYVVLAWNEKCLEWYNTGICGTGDTPLHAFTKGYTEFEYQKLSIGK